MPTGPDARVSALQDLLDDAGLDAILVTKDASIAYLSGFWGTQLERFFGVVVRRDGATLIAPSLDRESVNAAPGTLERELYSAGESNGLPELFARLEGATRVGVEEDHLVHYRGDALREAGFELVPAAGTMMHLREVKDAEEVDRVRAACAHIAVAYDELWASLKVGDSEQETNARVDYLLKRRGAREVHAHILFGAHSADSHGTPDARTLAAGDVVVADIAAQFDGYWGDITRCATAGAPGDWAQAAWNVVHEAYVAAVAASRPGVPARDVDAAQRSIVGAATDIGQVLHGAGHAIGNEIHEPPFLIPSSPATLRAGMIFTIEPGIYNSNVGGLRLEDDVLVGADGPVLLSHLPLELRVL